MAETTVFTAFRHVAGRIAIDNCEHTFASVSSTIRVLVKYMTIEMCQARLDRLSWPSHILSAIQLLCTMHAKSSTQTGRRADSLFDWLDGML